MLLRRGCASLGMRPSAWHRTAVTPRPALSVSTTIAARHAFSPRLLLRPAGRTWESTVANADGADAEPVTSVSEEKTDGHIAVTENESVMFFDNIFPLRLNYLNKTLKTETDLADLLKRYESSSLPFTDPMRLVRKAIPEDTEVKVVEIVPRLKDGGAFVKFKHSTSVDSSDLENSLLKQLESQPQTPWFNPFRSVRGRLVRGTPWLEDLYRFPTTLLKVEFVGPEPGTTPEELSEETLYSLFRQYGKLAEILPQPQDSKVVPRYSQLLFTGLRDAIMARNCMHGLVIDQALGGGKSGTRLRISYEKRVKPHSIWNWLTSHPRIVIPAIAALLATLSVVIFDPIREFFIRVHIRHSLQFTQSRIYKWFKSQASGFSLHSSRIQHEGENTLWNHRRDLIEQIQGWITEASDTFIVVSGPSGSGKTEMVQHQALSGRKNVLTIDCKPIVEARGEAETIKHLATSVGYRPVFSWANSLSGLIDLAVQGTTGVKAGFSESLETQLNKILQTTSVALKIEGLSGRHKKDKDAALPEDAFLEAHPERRPVVVIQNFGHKNDDGALVYDKMAEWAASLVQNNVAHVIFLTGEASSSKPLTKALPDRVFREIFLGDLEHDVATKFVMSRVQDDQHVEEIASDGEPHKPVQKPNLDGLDESITTLGGRLTDLEFLSRRLKTGQSPKEAVEEIVIEGATDIVKMHLLGRAGTGTSDKNYSVQQVWHIVKSLADKGFLRYHQVLLDPAFASSLTPSAADGEVALSALASTELIAIGYHNGRPQSITAGKPLHQAAFQHLVKDKVLRAKMDLMLLTECSKVEGKTIEAAEKELALLGGLPNQTRETTGRIVYLLAKLDGSQKKVVDLDKQMAALKKILQDEY